MDNLGFDGPTPYRDLTFDVPDSGLPADGGRRELGYRVGTAGRTFQVAGVYWSQTPTTALVLMNWQSQIPMTVPSVSVNGGPWHDTAWPFDPTTFGWRTIAVPVPLSEVHAGTNTITLKSPVDIVVSNINLGLIVAAPVP